MRKLSTIQAALALLALAAFPAGAHAASIVTGVTPALLAPPSSAMFGSVVMGSGETSTTVGNKFVFDIVAGPAIADVQVSIILLRGSQNIDLTAVTLDGLYYFFQTPSDPWPDTWKLSPVLLGNG